MSVETEPTDAILIPAARAEAVRRSMTAVTISHLPSGVVSARCRGLTALEATEMAALRALARKVEAAGSRTEG